MTTPIRWDRFVLTKKDCSSQHMPASSQIIEPLSALIVFRTSNGIHRIHVQVNASFRPQPRGVFEDALRLLLQASLEEENPGPVFRYRSQIHN